MKAQSRVLLIGESSQGSSHLFKRLEGHGCKCEFATSYQEAVSLLKTEEFVLVLSPMRIHDSSVFPLIGQLEGSRTSLFYFQPVEDGCWWLPALRFGRKCFGSNALRPSEFIALLELAIDEMEPSAPTVAKSLASIAPPGGCVPTGPVRNSQLQSGRTSSLVSSIEWQLREKTHWSPNRWR